MKNEGYEVLTPVFALVQARVGSQRLPAKVLRKMAGIPMIELLLRRLQTSEMLDGVALITGNLPRNQELGQIARKVGVAFVQGDEDDVLSRYIMAGEQLGAGSVVRVTGDNPLTSIDYMDKLVRHALKPGTGGINDYASINGLPRGCGCEWISMNALKRIDREIFQNDEEARWREHVTLWVRDIGAAASGYNKTSIDGPGGRGISVTVDTAEEFEMVRKIVESPGTDPLRLDVMQIIEGVKDE